MGRLERTSRKGLLAPHRRAYTATEIAARTPHGEVIGWLEPDGPGKPRQLTTPFAGSQASESRPDPLRLDVSAAVQHQK